MTRDEEKALKRALEGRRIVKAHTSHFENDQRVVTKSVLELNDGSRVHFRVRETGLGDYGVVLQVVKPFSF